MREALGVPIKVRLPGYTTSHYKGQKILYINVILAGRAITSYDIPKGRKFMGMVCCSICVLN